MRFFLHTIFHTCGAIKLPWGAAIISRRLRLQILIFLFFWFYFQRQSRLSWTAQPFRKNCDRQGRTRWYRYRWHWKLRGFTKVFIHEEWGNLKVFVDGGELTRNISKWKKPGVLQAYRCPLCGKCYRREYFFNTNVEYFESLSLVWSFSCENLRCTNSAVSAVMVKWFYKTV